MVASDRVSVFDVIMAEPIPDKGRVLTAMTSFWCEEMAEVVPGTILAVDPVASRGRWGAGAMPTGWAGRAVLVRRAEMLQLECIVRGYLAGQAYEEYERAGTVHGTAMPPPCGWPAGWPSRSSPPRPRPPRATTSTSTSPPPSTWWPRGGHRRPGHLPRAVQAGSGAPAAAGFVLADTKFELGYVDGALSLCDEVCTPDSSRYWPADEVVPGRTPPAFDKHPCATGWPRSPGTARRPRRRCPSR